MYRSCSYIFNKRVRFQSEYFWYNKDNHWQNFHYRVISLSCRTLLGFFSEMVLSKTTRAIFSERIFIDVFCVKVSCILITNCVLNKNLKLLWHFDQTAIFDIFPTLFPCHLPLFLFNQECKLVLTMKSWFSMVTIMRSFLCPSRFAISFVQFYISMRKSDCEKKVTMVDIWHFQQKWLLPPNRITDRRICPRPMKFRYNKCQCMYFREQ